VCQPGLNTCTIKEVGVGASLEFERDAVVDHLNEGKVMPGKITGGPSKLEKVDFADRSSGPAAEFKKKVGKSQSVNDHLESGAEEEWDKSGFEMVNSTELELGSEESKTPESVPKATPLNPSLVELDSGLKEPLLVTMEEGLTQASSVGEEQFHGLMLCRSGREFLRDLYQGGGNSSSELSIKKGLYDELKLDNLIESKAETGMLAGMQWLLSPAPVKALNRKLRGNIEHATERRDALAGIVLMMWALVGDGAAKGKLVERGSFKVVDPGQKLFQHLRNYVEFATGLKDPGFITNDFAYARNPDYPVLPLSSHYKQDSEQFGIDVRFHGGSSALGVLPGGHSHILFGQVHIENQPYTFIKLEEVGLGTMTEMALHGVHYAKSGTVEKKSYREKDLHPELVGAYREYCDAMGVPANAETVYGMWHVLKEGAVSEMSVGKGASSKKIGRDSVEDDWEYIEDVKPSAEDLIRAERAYKAFVEVAKRAGVLESLSIQTGEEVVLDYGLYAGKGSSGVQKSIKGADWKEIEEDFLLLDSDV